MANQFRLEHSRQAMNRILEALGLKDGMYTSAVLLLDCNQAVPLLYLTKVVDAEAVLRVAETLTGVEVVADPSVEVVELKPAGG